MPERPLAFVAAWKWWAGFLLITAIAGVGSLAAYLDALPPLYRIVWQFDKVLHFTCAGLLVFFLDGALRRRALTSFAGVPIPLAAAAVLVPVGVEEYLQRFSILRTSSVWDFGADLLGVIAFVPLSRRAAQ